MGNTDNWQNTLEPVITRYAGCKLGSDIELQTQDKMEAGKTLN